MIRLCWHRIRETTGGDTLVVKGADHGFNIAGDVLGSIKALEKAIQAVRRLSSAAGRGDHPLKLRRRPKKAYRVLWMALFIVGGVILGGESYFYLADPPIHSAGRNAVWLRHAWVGTPHTEGEYRTLAARLRRLHVTDAYFHAGPLTAQGTVDIRRIQHVQSLVAAMRRFAPGVSIQAWLGQVEAKGGGPLDLSSPPVRDGVVRTAEAFLARGFDGIHYDIEPIYSGDQDFLALLAATHARAAAHGKILSVATAKPEPIPGLSVTARLVARFPGYWTKNYFLAVAREADQVAVMTYDTGIYLPFLYGLLIAWTTRWSVRQGIDDLLIGVPTYAETKPGHLPYVENIGNALRGLKMGLAGLTPSERRKVGAAIYAEWTTSREEEEIFRRRWLGSLP